MSAVGFEPAIPTIERQQTCALDRSATGIGDHALNTTFLCHLFRHSYLSNTVLLL
jgi:hypothetical protein